MRTIERGAEFVLEDSPGLHWALGFLFLGLGALFVLAPLGLLVNGESVPWLQRAAVMVMGSCAVLAGLWILKGAPRSRVVLSRATGRVRITRTGVGGRTMNEWPAASVAAIQVRERKDDEGNDIFQIHLVLDAGRSEAASRLWAHGREASMTCARRLSEALKVPMRGDE